MWGRTDCWKYQDGLTVDVVEMNDDVGNDWPLMWQEVTIDVGGPSDDMGKYWPLMWGTAGDARASTNYVGKD